LKEFPGGTEVDIHTIYSPTLETLIELEKKMIKRSIANRVKHDMKQLSKTTTALVKAVSPAE